MKLDQNNPLYLFATLKATSVYEYVLLHNVSIMAFTETWLYAEEEENAVHINEFVPNEYYFKHSPRQDGRVGGGVGLLHHKSIKVVVHRSRSSVCTGITQFEYLDCTLSITNDPRSNIHLIIVYRPLPTRRNNLKLKIFWKEWKKLLTTLAKDHKAFAILGDLNFHLNIADDPHTQKFNNILEELNLVQLVKDPTHTAGHTLDVLVTQPENDFIVPQSIVVRDPGISSSTGNVTRCHHFAISFSLNYCKPKPVYQTISYRNLENLDKQAFLQDLKNANLENRLLQSEDVDEMVNELVTSTVAILDKHAPIMSKNIIQRSSNTWYTPALTKEKQKKRKLERRWLKSGLESHRLEYRKQCAVYSKMLYDTRIKDSERKITDCERDKAKLFRVCRSLINMPKTPIIIHGCNDDKETASALSSFFKTKTETIQTELESIASSLSNTLPHTSKLKLMTQCRNVPKLSKFQPVTPEFVEKLILASNNKSCKLDLIPVRILKMFVCQFASVITIIINCSLALGLVPRSFKSAIVFPKIKDYNLDHADPSNYRPVSNLPFLSKLLEKVVYKQIENHLNAYNLLPSSQSAYRKKHSTETSLLRLNNDILAALNIGKSTLLVTLDISAAFDTVNHQMLLDRYSCLFGLSDIALSWFSSYLSDRTQTVQVGTEQSNTVEMECGFAQGSTLGGPKYTMFTAPLDELIQLHHVNHSAYADDSNLYVSFDMKSKDDTTASFTQMERCLSDVKRWMIENRLKLNCKKTKAVIFHPARTSLKTEQCMTVIKMDNLEIKVSHEMKSLGVVFDNKMKMAKQINLTSRTAYMHLRRISKIRKQLNKSITETLVNAFITSRLDYCNSLYCSLPNKLTQKLQYVQNAAAKTIMLKKKRDHVTPLLRDLHWLPIKYRSQFKVLVLTWKIIHHLAPLNITNLISIHEPVRNLRSSSETLLNRLSIPRNSAGQRAFSNLSPFLWNNLPPIVRKASSITEFKVKLKTYFFNKHFGPT